jgi:hypothetical protein
MTHRYTQMDPQDALYNAARSYPGSVEALAHRMAMSPAVLRNKLSPNVKTHHVTLSEASLIIEFLREAKCDDALLPLQALNWQHGLIAHQIPNLDHMTDEQLSNSLVTIMKENGEVAAAMQEAMKDGRITETELDKVEKEIFDLVTAAVALRNRFRNAYEAQPNLRVA